MKKLRRLILLWILIMAIPLQGLAMASMMLCATDHHQIAAEHSPQANEHQHHHDAEHDADDDAGKTAAHHHASKDKCSSCAACCVGAAMLSSYSDAPVSGPSSEKIELVFSSHLGHISDGLERPPRS